MDVNNAVVTTRWRDAPVNQPENALVGVMYQDQVQQSYPYVVQNATNWIYAGTGSSTARACPGSSATSTTRPSATGSRPRA